MDATVTTVLLARLAQNRWSGRVSTLLRFSSVGGIGSAAGCSLIRLPRLITLTQTTYSGTTKTALTAMATSGRSQGARARFRFTGPPRAAAAPSARARWPWR